MSQSVNEGFSGLKRTVGVMYLVLFVMFLAHDYKIYRDNLNTNSCCGYVEVEWYKRPITHLMIDDWSKPLKSPTGNGDYIQEGMVDGVVYFWAFVDETNG